MFPSRFNCFEKLLPETLTIKGINRVEQIAITKKTLFIKHLAVYWFAPNYGKSEPMSYRWRNPCDAAPFLSPSAAVAENRCLIDLNYIYPLHLAHKPEVFGRRTATLRAP